MKARSILLVLSTITFLVGCGRPDLSADKVVVRSEKASPIGKFVAKRGPGLHHVCYSVPDIRRTLEDLATKGIEPIGAAPRPGAHGCQVAFLHPKASGGILVELSQPPFGGQHGTGGSETEDQTDGE